MQSRRESAELRLNEKSMPRLGGSVPSFASARGHAGMRKGWLDDTKKGRVDSLSRDKNLAAM